MKKDIGKQTILFLFLMLCVIFSSPAQWINSINFIPVAPTSQDTITAVADVSFGSGGCDVFSQGLNVAGSFFYAHALHCLGLASFICSTTDTFKINPLPVGNYNFVFQLFATQSPAPCIATTVGATDTASFSVSPVTSIHEIDFSKKHFSIFSNSDNGDFKIVLSSELASIRNKQLIIFSVDGKQIEQMEIENSETAFHLKLAGGIYLCRIIGDNFISSIVKMAVIK